jgi:glycerol-3-phosphate acyltransferase PlsX
MSAGNTGAAMAIAALDIGRIPGIERPAIATIMPSMKGESLLLDAGANVDCSPHNLLQFALLGSIYAERVMHISEPTIGLLSVGSEESKGNELTKATYKLLQRSPLRFYGNVEGKDVFEHITDVVVCDGFVGNVVLKSGEGLAELIMTLLRKHSESFPPECLKPVREMFGALMKSLDYAETGGAPLLGINGASVIAHGRSRHKAISNAIKNTIAAAESDMVAAVREALPHLVHREQAVVDGGAA